MNLQTILDFLAQPGMRWVLSLIGAFLLKKNPTIVTKAIPLMLTVGNTLLLLVDALWGTQAPSAVTSGFAAVIFTPAIVSLPGVAGFILNPLVEAVVTTFLGTPVGAHSAVKNLWQWIRAGAMLVVPRGDPRGR